MPMRVIAKKRCRAMVEPPEKGERATLNPNLSTRLKPTFFRSGALGRRVGYCWSRRRAALQVCRHNVGLGMVSPIVVAVIGSDGRAARRCGSRSKRRGGDAFTAPGNF